MNQNSDFFASGHIFRKIKHFKNSKIQKHLFIENWSPVMYSANIFFWKIQPIFYMKNDFENLKCAEFVHNFGT